MITLAPPSIGPSTSSDSGLESVVPPRYRAAMTTSANSVIAAIDFRRPGLKAGKKLLLLFFAQGHHLAWSGQPLFDEPMYATDRGVTFQGFSDKPVEQPDTEAELNTVGYIIARYSALSPADLRTLIQSSRPWQHATKPDGDSRIDCLLLTDWFRRPDETDDPDDERPNRAEVAAVESFLASRT
jgi:uncharacterized phage-associated protein